MSLHNVSDEIVRPQYPVHDVQPILTLASEFIPDIKKIMAGIDDPMDLVVRSHFENHIVLELVVQNQREQKDDVLSGLPTSPPQSDIVFSIVSVHE